MNIFNDRRLAEADVVLRRGGNINRTDISVFDFVSHHFDEIQSWYAYYGSTLHRHSAGCFFLVSNDDLMPSTPLPRACVHLGLLIELKTRKADITKTSGRLSASLLLNELETTVPRETLRRVYSPHNGGLTQDRTIVKTFDKTVRQLAALGFIGLTGDIVQPLEAIHRFADVAQYDNSPDGDARLRLAITLGIIFDGNPASNRPDEE
jgi:chromosome condensin MukBEF MukE localization factor